jgi:two-component system OmpR family sensor kinase
MRLLIDELALLAPLDAAQSLDHVPVDVVALAGVVVEDASMVDTDEAIILTGWPRPSFM